jgi:hypothetical protein
MVRAGTASGGPRSLTIGRGEVRAPGRNDPALRPAGVGSCIACLRHPKPARRARINEVCDATKRHPEAARGQTAGRGEAAAGPIRIVIVGGGFVACTARGAWNPAGGAAMPRSRVANSRTTCCPRRCRLGGVGPGRTPPRGRAAVAGAAPRASAWARSPNIDLDLRTCTYRQPSGDEQVISWDRLVFAPRVGQPPGSRPGPGRARLLMLPTWGGDFGSGWTGRSLSPCPRHRRTRLVRPHGAAGCQGRGALVADTGPPPTQVGRLHHSDQVDR